MNRREFCHRISIVGGSVVLAPLVKACAQSPGMTPTATVPGEADTPMMTATQRLAITSEPTLIPADAQLSASPSETIAPHPDPTLEQAKDPGIATVALVKTKNRSEGVKQAIQLLGVSPARGNRVFLKPNLNSADPAPGSTHMDVMHALVTELYDMGARAITVGDRSGMGDTRSVMQQTGVLDMANVLGFETLVFDELAEDDWVVRQSSDYHWSSGFAVPKMLLDSECVVQTCNLKTHRYGGHFTLALKNSVGFAAKLANGSHDYMRELHNSPYQRQMIAEINTAYKPDLIVMDGVEAFVNGGPAKGKKVKSEVVLAATDPVAIDAVGSGHSATVRNNARGYARPGI